MKKVYVFVRSTNSYTVGFTWWVESCSVFLKQVPDVIAIPPVLLMPGDQVVAAVRPTTRALVCSLLSDDSVVGGMTSWTPEVSVVLRH